MKSWREQLQSEIDDTARLRANSLYRQGDHITSTKPCLEGAGRARVIPCEKSMEQRVYL